MQHKGKLRATTVGFEVYWKREKGSVSISKTKRSGYVDRYDFEPDEATGGWIPEKNPKFTYFFDQDAVNEAKEVYAEVKKRRILQER